MSYLRDMLLRIHEVGRTVCGLLTDNSAKVTANLGFDDVVVDSYQFVYIY